MKRALIVVSVLFTLAVLLLPFAAIGGAL